MSLPSRELRSCAWPNWSSEPPPSPVASQSIPSGPKAIVPPLWLFASVWLARHTVRIQLAFAVFGSEFPGTEIIGRLYVIHILLVPGILVGLISAHMGLLIHQKHTQFRGPGRTEHNVVGTRLYPVFALKTGGFFALVFSMLAFTITAYTFDNFDLQFDWRIAPAGNSAVKYLVTEDRKELPAGSISRQ